MGTAQEADIGGSYNPFMPVAAKTAWLFWWYLSNKRLSWKYLEIYSLEVYLKLLFKYFSNIGFIPKISLLRKSASTNRLIIVLNEPCLVGQQKMMQKAWKWLKLCHMGTHLRVLGECYPMNTNMKGSCCLASGKHFSFKYFQKILLSKKCYQNCQACFGCSECEWVNVPTTIIIDPPVLSHSLPRREEERPALFYAQNNVNPGSKLVWTTGA